MLLSLLLQQSHLLPTRNSSQCLERCASRVVSLRYLSKQALQQNCFHPKRWRTRPKRPLHMSHRRLLTLFEPGAMKEICALRAVAADLIYRRADWKQITPAVTPINLSPQPYLLWLRRARLSHRLDLHGVLDFHQHPRANEDLPWLGLVAQPRGGRWTPYR